MLRPITAEDFDRVYAVYMDKTVNPYMTYPVMEKQAFYPVFSDLKQRDEFLAFEVNGEMVGFCTLARGRGRTQHKVMIESLGITGAQQGKGVGTLFMKGLLKHIARQGVKRVELIVESDNEKAINFYQKMGFAIEGRLRSYFKRKAQYIDDLYMALVWDR
jgi:putative acetyltransferase